MVLLISTKEFSLPEPMLLLSAKVVPQRSQVASAQKIG
jgi:hypothetical protein